MAELECGHNQHIRHQPPYQWREWVFEADSRAARVGTPLVCPLCDRAELPEALRSVRVAKWDEGSLPAGLRRAHRLGPGTWGRLTVQAGRLRFRAATETRLTTVLEAGDVQAIPPGMEHEVELDGPVQFSLEFLAVERTPSSAPRGAGPEGGEPACLAPLVCPECGGVAGDGDGHHPGCESGSETP